VKIVKTLYGLGADALRSYVEARGVGKFYSDNLGGLRKLYEEAHFKDDIEISDDRENNIFVITESYTISPQVFTDKKVLKVFSTIVRKYLETQVKASRSSPLSLAYPHWITEHIHVENPFFEWTPSSKEFSYKHDSMEYTHTRKRDAHTLDLYFELKNLDNYVAQNKMKEYAKIVSDVKKQGTMELTIAENIHR
jgi:hypothetical protein